MTKPYRILALDGGGIRGLMSAIWLDRLEQALAPRPLRECFDLVAGTSTGSFLACSVAMGKPASTLIDLYHQKGLQIFPRFRGMFFNGGWRAPRTWFPRFRQAFLGPKYTATGIQAAADDVFGDATFSDLTPRTIVTSYETFMGRPRIFDSAVASNISVADICLASSAAPTFFPAHVFVDSESGEQLSLIDGGVCANNPTMRAISEAVKETGNGLSDMVVASFGTGETVERIRGSQAKRLAGVSWLPRIVPLLFDGASDEVHCQAKNMLAPDRYWRFQRVLEQKYAAMDDASPANLRALTSLALGYIEGDVGRRQLDQLVEKLGETS